MTNPGRFSRSLCQVVGLLLLVCAACTVQAQERVEVQLSANRVSVDESVILSVRAYGMDKELDASALGIDFAVTQRSSSRQITIDNGKRTSLVEWVLELVPNRTGVLEIPPIKVGDEQSLPLTLLVEKPASGANRDLFLEASVDIENPYVQSQVIYTLRVLQDVRILDASLNVPELDDIEMQQLGDEKTYQETVEGRQYVVSEIRYAVFPQQSGKVTIPPISLQAVVPVDPSLVPNTRTRTKRLTRRANDVVLNVRSRPEGLAGSWWLPAKNVQLQSEWSAPIDSMRVDQPVTRTIHLMATGVGDTQLPEIDVSSVDNISVYADSPTVATNTNERGLMSQQTNTWAVIPQVSGQLVLPEIRVNWFDTTTGEPRVAVLAEEVLDVQPSSQANGAQGDAGNPGQNASALTTQSQQPASGENAGSDVPDTDALAEQIDESLPNSANDTTGDKQSNAMSNVASVDLLRAVGRWKSIAMGLLAGWVVSLLALWFWWRRRHRVEQVQSLATNTESPAMRFRRRAGSRAALDPVKTACEKGDASKIASSVLSWGGMVWPDNPPTHIIDVAKRLESPSLETIFSDLDAELYGGAAHVNSVAVESIPSILKNAVDQYQLPQHESGHPNALPSL